jgi:hypothetical protein
MKDEAIPSEYLGDGVYASHDTWHIVLSVQSYAATENVIYLDPDVWRALKAYARRHKTEIGLPLIDSEEDEPAEKR